MRLVNEAEHPPDFLYREVVLDEEDLRPLHPAGEEVLGKAGVHPKQIEGYQTANWILMDYGDVVIHIFDEENRLFYDLERIWRDGKVVEKEEIM